MGVTIQKFEEVVVIRSLNKATPTKVLHINKRARVAETLSFKSSICDEKHYFDIDVTYFKSRAESDLECNCYPSSKSILLSFLFLRGCWK